MMIEGIDQPTPEKLPKSPEEILGEVGLTPEELKGRRTLFYGNGFDSLEGKIPQAYIQDENIDLYIETEFLVPEGNRVDYIISLESDINGDLTYPFQADLLEVAIDTLRDNGEIRIANPVVPPEDDLVEVERNYSQMYRDRNLNIKVKYQEIDENEFLLIIRRPENPSDFSDVE